MSEKLKVCFKEISNGWLEVQIQLDELLINFVASSVPYDSIYELTKGLVIFASAHTTQTIKWNTEPVEYDFGFSTGFEPSEC